ncbi:hypothetical protein MXB_4749 [Myxobolus squamalis]|nr:hypothetical protein MXB_4749 [Myxobolus squamalis]
MIDIETAQIIKKFRNENMTRYPAINCASITMDHNLLLFNGDLFCTRSGKLVISFPTFNQHLSGIFVHLDTRILINGDLWELRINKLCDRIKDLENFILKKTYNEDTLIAIQCIFDYFHVQSSPKL